ncbi:helix-turn-helix transcriptional regulator [Nocardia wallacei]|uniref:helix-turn-helix transcriptional regulator n=1 Tax=Nocardia wallacei TaxID=480035 RepID=UPI002454F64C|nr:WYL domain-containing protein [Nocardia wallacei]
MTPDRFFSLMLLLETRDAVTSSDLAAALGVSLRTITRDLNWLRDAGFPVSAQRGRLGGVQVLPSAGLDLTRLTPGEREHLTLTGLDEKQREDLDASIEGRRALAKITSARRPHIGDLLPLAEVVHVDNRPWLQQHPDGTAPAALIGPVRRGRQLRIEYGSSRERQRLDLVVDPYGLLAKGGIWYLVADCDRVPRMYRLERITAWSETDRARRTRPDQTLASVAAALTERWARAHVVEVTATFDPTQIERAKWIFGQRLRQDGHQVTIQFLHLEDVRALLPFGKSVTVHGPPEAKARLHDLANELADHYRPS